MFTVFPGGIVCAGWSGSILWVSPGLAPSPSRHDIGRSGKCAAEVLARAAGSWKPSKPPPDSPGHLTVYHPILSYAPTMHAKSAVAGTMRKAVEVPFSVGLACFFFFSSLCRQTPLGEEGISATPSYDPVLDALHPRVESLEQPIPLFPCHAHSLLSLLPVVVVLLMFRCLFSSDLPAIHPQ